MSILNVLMYWLTRPFIRTQLVTDEKNSESGIDSSKPISYVLMTDSYTDKLALKQAAKRLNLPSPFGSIDLDSDSVKRTIGVKPVDSIFLNKDHHAKKTVKTGQAMLELVERTGKDIQFVPVMICWGRNPGVEKDTNRKTRLMDIITQTLQASPFRKFMIVLLYGRSSFIRISKPVSLQKMVNDYGPSEETAHKLVRVARIHFERQRIVATGPKVMERQAFFNSMLASPALKKALHEEMESKDISLEEAKANAKKLLEEIAGDYNENYIRMGSRILTWVWNKIYNGIRVHNADKLRDLAQKGHEIVYVPCHRSHMDYLLLTYVIYHEGLVPPHIAAGINLNFWPAGPVFRKAGAFFLRRSFKGNKLYSAVFREYLSQLFIKGYPVKYYTEGGRSRTGRLLSPKTGMLAMTIQSMLRGVDRPITLVPVYIGYEHVMEVNTYLSELKGKSKESESIFGIFKAIKNLKNYGHGDVNFGEPISLNEIMNEQAPDWRSLINPVDVVKPNWLTPVVNHTANKVMGSINDAAVLNTVNLSALALLTSDSHALPRVEMEALIEFYIGLQTSVPYSNLVKTPTESASAIIDEAILLEKVDSDSDEYGTIIKLDDKNAILMSYYRNNVVHLFAIAAIVAAELTHSSKTSSDKIKQKVTNILPLLKNEMFITTEDVDGYVDKIIGYFAQNDIIEVSDDTLSIRNRSSLGSLQLSLLAKIMKDTLQRYALAFNRIQQVHGIQRSELESDCLKLAKRLLTLHDIKAPEYFDKKITSSFVSCIKEQKYVETDEAGLMHLTDAGKATAEDINSLLESDILQSLQSLG
ncbi:glycerol-3-phosphate 1-O-acyltransferase PlsB [Psychrosphaera haliotis]|uniref:Glycerol-3-phosphate acyltransferase n=1 Tax=Psychrosphaera haliotis TaxID=555083 RepID=A0A6N8FAF3_9GAMM|nr:glycerol-3-phosphate 1-O-acyltransferase PlsB [Psychrosphaera haliotis]MUH73595.1 glycerol-3-phosphate 1-O-acyltransferase PlsB [Psychrosphaera haliotis]